MRIRYKKSGTEASSSRFNIHAIGEVLTGDDSPFIKELDVYLEATGEWKDMSQAFEDGDIIVNNHNTSFFEPPTEEDRQRGYTLH